MTASWRVEERRRKPAKTWGSGEGGRELGRGGGGNRKHSVGDRIRPPLLQPPPPQQQLTSECVSCVGWRAGWMGRGGDGVGGNWRGVALTHQATVYKNKTCRQENGTVFFLHLLPLPKGLWKTQKKWHMFNLWRGSLSLYLAFCSLTYLSFLPVSHSLIRTFFHLLLTSFVPQLIFWRLLNQCHFSSY